ncbi:hypothetical protein HY418_01735 [Candidatus Kaiserbacteria bacterium]|nr:hypothetical protein [Candidatus Kaiserbacteria bacterium]
MPPEVRFENQGEEFGRPPQEAVGFDLAGKMVQWGLVASRKEAEYVLIGVGVVALLIAIFIFWSGASGGHAAPPPPPNLAPSITPNR